MCEALKMASCIFNIAGFESGYGPRRINRSEKRLSEAPPETGGSRIDCESEKQMEPVLVKGRIFSAWIPKTGPRQPIWGSNRVVIRFWHPKTGYFSVFASYSLSQNLQKSAFGDQIGQFLCSF
jgi:hypothetical protein